MRACPLSLHGQAGRVRAEMLAGQKGTISTQDCSATNELDLATARGDWPSRSGLRFLGDKLKAAWVNGASMSLPAALWRKLKVLQ